MNPEPDAHRDLVALSTADLWRLLIRSEDRVPRNLIDECVRRGDEILDLAEGVLGKEYFWSDDVGGGEWWLRLHAVMILGLLQGERAGTLLAQFLGRIDEARDEDLQDWLAGHWPAFFRNKPEETIEALAPLIADRSRDGFVRIDALEVVLARAAEAGEEALGRALRTVETFAFDESEDLQTRSMAGSRLLDFARPEHRTRLEKLADAQSGPYPVFDRESVREAYTAAASGIPTARSDDPWRFYEPGEIEARQRRWEKEAAARSRVVWDEPGESYVREIPKVGRNDPCPCGSGKKYKKCCLGTAE